VLENIGEVALDDEGETHEFNEGEIKVCKYRIIEPFMHDGRVELI